MTFAFAVASSIGSWLCSNYENQNKFLIFATIIFSFILLAITIFIFLKINTKIKELDL